MLQNGQMIDFVQNITPNLGQIISGTKCDRDKQFFSAVRGSIPGKSPTTFKYGSGPPPPPSYHTPIQ